MRFILVGLLTSLIVGCGFEKLTTDLTSEIGKGIGDGIAKAMNCSIKAIFSDFENDAEVQMKQSDFDAIILLIKGTGAQDSAQVWKVMAQQQSDLVVGQLRAQVIQKSWKTEEETPTVEQLSELFARGMLFENQLPADASQYKFSQSYTYKGKDGKDLTGYHGVKVTITDSKSKATTPKTYQFCD